MKMMKRIAALLLVLGVIVSLCGSALAANYTCYTTGKCNLRRGPGTNFSSKKTLKKGVELVASEGEYDDRGILWVHVVGSYGSGWVCTTNLKKEKKVPVTYMVKAVDGSTVIRSIPSTDGRKLGTLSKGKSGTYLQLRAKDSRGVTWYRITYKGVKGWVSSRYTEIR